MAMKTRQETSDSDASLLGRSRDEEERPIETPGALGHFKTALIAMVIFTLALGVAAPLVMTGIARIAFPRQSQGSIITQGGQPVGSSLIGQALDPKVQPFYFQNRPSAIASAGTPAPYDAGNAGSGASNLSQTSKAQHDAVATNVAGVQSAFPGATSVPADLVEASGSGLDPHITPESARLQVAAIVQNRQQAGQQITADAVQKLVDKNTDGRTFGILGQPRVNVLKLNLALDAQFGKPKQQ
ncbi:MAG: potassium-transporting ATPase subunit KdpC [Chloroflexota bacterium]|nr:potassium-transporting ATPase subunit KdpC [Chloroflexota bacterium]